MSIQFKGYKRPDGSYGIRNYVLILPSVTCSSETCAKIAAAVEGCISLPNQGGCAQVGDDAEQTARTLAGFGYHPNVAAILVVGLGCETVNAIQLANDVRKSGKPTEVITIQDIGGTVKTIAKGIEMAKKLKAYADMIPTEMVGLDKLIVGVECGGSDTTSGLAANPVAGYASDKLIEAGGSTFLSETPELIGAEHILAENASTPEVGQQILDMVHRFETRLKENGVDFRGAQPSPGNIQGGLTTIEEKSLGAVYKSGTSPITGVLEYAERPKSAGHFLMDSPGYDIESITGMIAGGAQIIIFTTGRGTPVGSPIAPVIKVCGNPKMARLMDDNTDINAGYVIEGEKSIQEVGEELFQEIVDVANGKLVKAEVHGFREFAINRIGPSY